MRRMKVKDIFKRKYPYPIFLIETKFKFVIKVC